MSEITATEGPSDESSEARDLLARFLDRLDGDPALRFDDWLSGQPEHLRAEVSDLYDAYKALRMQLPGSKFAHSWAFFRQGERERPQPAPGLAPGKVIGDFRLVSLIDQGGMGQVWEAQQLSLGNRRVAIKFVRPELVTERKLELFAREARAGARLNHPGIVTVYGFGHSDGHSWISMEYVEGAWTLKDFLDEASRNGALPEGYDRRVATFVAKIADAMQAAHDAGVIHRDLKPQNILITPDDSPKVTDFGLARINDETALSRTGDFAGTYYYMSPEQVAARRMGIDHRTDVFSLGVVLYELLALRRPFEGDTGHQVADQIVTKEPPDLRTVRSRVPRDLAVIVAVAIQKDRDRRFQAIAHLSDDLRRYLGDEPIWSSPPNWFERIVKCAKRNPVKGVAAAIAAAAFAVIALLLAANLRANVALARKSMESEERRERAEEKEKHLASLQRLSDLLARADMLWPAYPSNIARYSAWLAGAEELLDGLPMHIRSLLVLRAKGVSRDDVMRGQELERLAEAEAELASLLAAVGNIDAGGLGDPTSRVARLESFLELLRDHAERGRKLAYSDPQDEWWEGQLERLVYGVQELVTEKVGLYWEVRRRRDAALSLQGAYQSDGEYARAWSAALPDIERVYDGLRLRPQVGLVPLRRDGQSGLWQFVYVGMAGSSGGVEVCGDRLDESALVFVLMKSEWRDEFGKERRIKAPLFVVKELLTEKQWALLEGGQFIDVWGGEGGYGRGISAQSCVLVLGRAGMQLPSIDQWEEIVGGGIASSWEVVALAPFDLAWGGPDLGLAADLLDGWRRVVAQSRLGDSDGGRIQGDLVAPVRVVSGRIAMRVAGDPSVRVSELPCSGANRALVCGVRPIIPVDQSIDAAALLR